MFDASGFYRLDPGVVIRPAAYGAVAYRPGRSRLAFPLSPPLVLVLVELSGFSSPDAALDRLGVVGRQRSLHQRSLEQLAAAGMIHAK